MKIPGQERRSRSWSGCSDFISC